MLFRNRPPNQGRWNGLGGKLDADETPLAGIYREVMEEAGIDLAQAESVRFAGLVTWPNGADPTRPSQGMYAFVARLPLDFPIWADERVTPEGRLVWQPLEWVCDVNNETVVPNIPRFLPLMLSDMPPQEYFCHHIGERFTELEIRPLPTEG